MRLAITTSLLIACGDNGLPPEPMFTGLSGSRIKLQWVLYADRTQHLEPTAFYDTHLHERCEPKLWADGVARCAPFADATVFRDAECTSELGHTKATRTPKYFIGHDRIEGELRAARLLRAGARVETAPLRFFERRDGACTPISEPETIAYYEIANEVDLGVLSEVWLDHMDGERLGLVLLAGIDGLSAPIGYYDQTFEVPCRPEVVDGASACAPAEAIAAAHFADPYCEQRVVVAKTPPPAIWIADANNCPLYHGAGSEHVSLLYRREGTACVRAFLKTGEHAYRVGEPLALAPVERVLEDEPARRLQRRITTGAGSMLTFDPLLYDTATRTDCRSYNNGEFAVCAPTNALIGTRLFANDKCSRELLVTDVPRMQCTPSTFAVVDLMALHAIGSPYTATIYMLDAAGCRPRPAIPDAVPHVLGPPLPPTTFVTGVLFSER